MSGKIFINYRRDDAPSFTTALFLRLEREFLDVEGQTKYGDDFVEVLKDHVAASDVLIVVIGPRWSALFADRKDDPHDFVTLEIATALKLKKRLIPVFAEGASMPRADSMPALIRPLARRQGLSIRRDNFEADFKLLMSALKDALMSAHRERIEDWEEKRSPLYQQRIKDFMIFTLFGAGVRVPGMITGYYDMPTDPKLGRPELTLLQYTIAAAFLRGAISVIMLIGFFGDLFLGSAPVKFPFMIPFAIGDGVLGLVTGVLAVRQHIAFALAFGVLAACPLYLWGAWLFSGVVPYLSSWSLGAVIFIIVPPLVCILLIRFYLLHFGFGKRRYIPLKKRGP